MLYRKVALSDGWHRLPGPLLRSYRGQPYFCWGKLASGHVIGACIANMYSEHPTCMDLSSVLNFLISAEDEMCIKFQDIFSKEFPFLSDECVFKEEAIPAIGSSKISLVNDIGLPIPIDFVGFGNECSKQTALIEFARIESARLQVVKRLQNTLRSWPTCPELAGTLHKCGLPLAVRMRPNKQERTAQAFLACSVQH